MAVCVCVNVCVEAGPSVLRLSLLIKSSSHTEPREMRENAALAVKHIPAKAFEL